MKCHAPDRAADFVERGWWSTDTIDGLLRARVHESADQLALVDPPNTDELLGTPPVRWTWRELDNQVDALAALLLRRGVRAGDVVAVQLPNSSQLVRAFLAIVRIGAIVTPFPVSYREHELTRMCARVGAVALITTATNGTHDLAAQACRVREAVPTLRYLLGWGPDLPSEVESFTEIEVGDAGSLVARHVEELEVDVNDCVTICWTSGTEAEPKAVPRCHGDWLAMATATCAAARLGSEDVLLSPFPMINMAGISGMFLPWLMVGGVFVPHHPFELPVFLRQIAEERVTYTVAPPALLTMLLHRDDVLSTVDMSSVRLIGSGSAPLSPWMVRNWAERHGIGVINFFGSNEGTALLSDPYDIPDPDQRATYFPNYASATRWSNPIAERTTVRLVDTVSGEPIREPGHAGEVRISGPTVFAGYLTGRPGSELDRSPFDEDGFFRTGDVFEIAGNAGQFLHYVDRAKDLIIRGGMNISPAEMEGLLAEHPGVADVAVVGVPDETMGERVCAVVVPNGAEPPSLPDLTEFLRQRQVASFKLPERVEIVSELPRNPVGKILKRQLRSSISSAQEVVS